MSLFGFYSGRELMALKGKLKPRAWMIENIMRENDSVILVGNEKSGKSLLIKQMICALTTANPFLEQFEVPNEYRVVYVQIEGELIDTVDRFDRMFETLDVNLDKFTLNFTQPLELQSKRATKELVKGLVELQPDLVIIDPIYFCMSGDLSDNTAVRALIGNMRRLKDALSCALILVHHTHKLRFNNKGELLDEGDDAIFGSKFFKAWADHTIMLAHNPKTNLRSISCSTQRAGDIVKKLELKLVEPSPLYFEVTEARPTREAQVIQLLSNVKYKEKGAGWEEVCGELKISKNIFFATAKKLLGQKVVSKTSTRPVFYKLVS